MASAAHGPSSGAFLQPAYTDLLTNLPVLILSQRMLATTCSHKALCRDRKETPEGAGLETECTPHPLARSMEARDKEREQEKDRELRD